MSDISKRNTRRLAIIAHATSISSRLATITREMTHLKTIPAFHVFRITRFLKHQHQRNKQREQESGLMQGGRGIFLGGGYVPDNREQHDQVSHNCDISCRDNHAQSVPYSHIPCIGLWTCWEVPTSTLSSWTEYRTFSAFMTFLIAILTGEFRGFRTIEFQVTCLIAIATGHQIWIRLVGAILGMVTFLT
jgi:hypothetical protein